MSPAEIAWRVREQALRRAWSRRQVRPDQVGRCLAVTHGGARRFTSALPAGTAAWCRRPPGPRSSPTPDRLLGGEWEMLGVVRTDMKDPDWFHDPVTGRRSDPEAYAFRLNQRDEGRSATSSRSGRSTGCST